MATIRYAFRDDPLNIYMLTEGATESRKYTQILSFRRREVALSFLDDYYYLDSKAPTDALMSPVGKATQNRNWINPLCYVAKVESQVEFVVKRSVFEKLVESFYPAWKPNMPLSYFGDQPSGYITFLRVYRTGQSVDEQLLSKGRQGGSQIYRLYDKEEQTTVQAEILEPVLTDARFDYIKEEILYILKKEDAFIAYYSNDSEGRDLLKERIAATKTIATKHTYQERFDPSADIDMAQADYGEIYREIKQLAPSMQDFVDYVSAIKPSQIGETDYMLPLAKSGNQVARHRVIEMNLRAALRYALWVYKQYDVDLEDAVQEAICGLIIAIEKYPTNSERRFQTYSHMWMRQSVSRNLPIGEYVARLPAHYLEKVAPILRFQREHNCGGCSELYSCPDLSGIVCETLGCEKDQAMQQLLMITPPESVEKLIDDDAEVISEDNLDEKLINGVFAEEMSAAIENALSSLSEREQYVLKRRSGYYGKEATLEELGQELSVTRERIRQIETKAKKRMLHPSRKSKIIEFY